MQSWAHVLPCRMGWPAAAKSDVDWCKLPRTALQTSGAPADLGGVAEREAEKRELMSSVPVIVVLDDTTDFNCVKNACASHGLKKISALPRLRMLKGFIEQKSIPKLMKIQGVQSVEREREIKLPPPHSPVQ
jgi:hypothetical protein